MNFCPGCGSPNLDTDATCRVCGRNLHDALAPATSPVHATSAGATAVDAAPGGDVAPPVATDTAAPAAPPPDMSVAPAAGDLSGEPAISAGSSTAVTFPVTGPATPSGFESQRAATSPDSPRPDETLPSFMRHEGRASGASPIETGSLISEHDLPDWIRQIAAEDARKLAESEGQASAAAASTPGGALPSHLGRRALPGETLTSGPAPSSWLNRRDAVANAASAAWDVTGAPSQSQSPSPAQPTAAPASSEAPADVVIDERTPAPGRRGLRRGAKAEPVAPAPSETGASPEPRPSALGGASTNRLYLLAVAALAVIVLLALVAL